MARVAIVFEARFPPPVFHLLGRLGRLSATLSMNSSVKLVLVALISAGLTGGAVYTYFQTAPKPGSEAELFAELTQRAKHGGVPVVLWWDSPDQAVEDALRLDVRDGLVTDGKTVIPLADVAGYVDAAVAKRHVRYLVVNTPIEGKLGEVVGVVDRSRKCRLQAIMLNFAIFYPADTDR